MPPPRWDMQNLTLPTNTLHTSCCASRLSMERKKPFRDTKRRSNFALIIRDKDSRRWIPRPPMENIIQYLGPAAPHSTHSSRSDPYETCSLTVQVQQSAIGDRASRHRALRKSPLQNKMVASMLRWVSHLVNQPRVPFLKQSCGQIGRARSSSQFRVGHVVAISA